jgi:transposase
VRLRVENDTGWRTCNTHVCHSTRQQTKVYTDEWGGYSGLSTPVRAWLGIRREHATVCHSLKEWARDDDGDGVREVHTNTLEGLWAEVRTFLRPFRGVHKSYLSGYIAVCEWRINLKRISPAFICALVAQFFPLHSFCT